MRLKSVPAGEYSLEREEVSQADRGLGMWREGRCVPMALCPLLLPLSSAYLSPGEGGRGQGELGAAPFALSGFLGS